MNVIFYNFIPDQIRSQDIEEILHRLMNSLLIQGVQVADGKESMNFLRELLDFYSLRNEELVKEVAVCLTTYSAETRIKKSAPIYKIFESGYKNGIILKDSKFVIVSGDLYRLPFPYGVAYENVCMIKKPTKEVIWHETAHLLGMKDHYAEDDSHNTICGDDECFMQWDPEKGDHFCKTAISEEKSARSKTNPTGVRS